LSIIVPAGYSDRGIERNGKALFKKGSIMRQAGLLLFLVILFSSISAQAGSKYTNYDLFTAIDNGQVETVRAMIKQGVDVNWRLRRGGAPLMSASAKGNLEIVRMLIASGAFVNAISQDGTTALLLASKYGHGDVVRVLLENGAEYNHDRVGLSPMTLASENGHMNVVAIFMKMGRGRSGARTAN